MRSSLCGLVLALFMTGAAHAQIGNILIQWHDGLPEMPVEIGDNHQFRIVTNQGTESTVTRFSFWSNDERLWTTIANGRKFKVVIYDPSDSDEVVMESRWKLVHPGTTAYELKTLKWKLPPEN